MKQFKIRASAGGKITSQPRAKKDKELGLLSATSKSYCEEWVKEQLYSRRHEFSSKQTQKGNEVEDESLDFLANKLSLGFIIKNEKWFENDYFTGTPDAILKDLIIDVKNSWDCFTFPLFDLSVPNKDYYWQAQVYMDLVGIDEYKLVYVLSDTPMHLIEREAYFQSKNQGFEDLEINILKKCLKSMTYGDIDNSLKIKVFDIQKNQEDIDFLKGQVEKCRNYIKTLNERY